MVTFLITSVVLLGLVAIAIYFWQKPANQTQTIELPPPPVHGRGLFADAPAEPPALPPADVSTVSKTPDTKAEAEALIASFPAAPDRNSTVRMLHTAALSDDAATYQKAVDAALRDRKSTRLNSSHS